jgi:hypothetical protein
VKVEIKTVRLAVTGNPSGSSLYHLLEVMGRIEREMAAIG